MFVFTQVLGESEDGAAYRTPDPLTADDVVRPIQQHSKITFPIIFTERRHTLLTKSRWERMLLERRNQLQPGLRDNLSKDI